MYIICVHEIYTYVHTHLYTYVCIDIHISYVTYMYEIHNTYIRDIYIHIHIHKIYKVNVFIIYVICL